MVKIAAVLKDINHLLFPESCIACEAELTATELYLCVFCMSGLNYTGFERTSTSSPLDRLFWGRIKLHATYSLLYFQENSAVQHILHRLKYQHNPEVAKICGEWLGEKLSKMQTMSDADALIPVPLHPKKQFERGFNQSEMIAKGISEKTGICVNITLLSKKNNTGSQTRKGRFGRWANIKNGFLAGQFQSLAHVIIVDDVITTGATIESMVNTIHVVYPQCKISVVSLAFASSV